MRDSIFRVIPGCAALLLVCSCASTPYRTVARRITPPQWDTVVECVTMAARASGKEVFVTDFGVSVPTYVKRQWGIEDIQFIWGPKTSSAFVVHSRIVARDARAGNLEPMEGPSQETRRLRQQLDQQCLQSYPVADTTNGL
jgi:hypothetical protein